MRCSLDARQLRPSTQAETVIQQAQVESRCVYFLLIAGQQRVDLSSSEYHYLIMENVEMEDTIWQGWMSEVDGRVEEDVPCFRRLGLASRFVRDRKDEVLFDFATEMPAGNGEELQGGSHAEPVLRKLVLV